MYVKKGVNKIRLRRKEWEEEGSMDRSGREQLKEE